MSGRISLLVTVTVEPENAAALEAGLGALAAKTLANEPGVLVYQLCRSEADPRTYRLFELYESQAALDSHRQTDWFKAAGPAIAALFAAPPTMEQLVPLP